MLILSIWISHVRMWVCQHAFVCLSVLPFIHPGIHFEWFYTTTQTVDTQRWYEDIAIRAVRVNAAPSIVCWAACDRWAALLWPFADVGEKSSVVFCVTDRSTELNCQFFRFRWRQILSSFLWFLRALSETQHGRINFAIDSRCADLALGSYWQLGVRFLFTV